MADSIYKKLAELQLELKAPKNQHNKFGNYNYRSAEDILEALKPLLVKHKLTLTIEDDIVQISERFYVKAIAHLYDSESGNVICTSAFARESVDGKGMSDSQLTGSASSYSRKYCLNGLFLLDDSKDDDTDEAHIEKEARAEAANKKKNKAESLPQKEQTILKELVAKAGLELASTFPNGIEYMTAEQYREACIKLNGLIEKKKAKA